MKKKYSYYVYIMTNKNNGTLYIGVTNNILKRSSEHRTGIVEGFTKEYKLKKLVYIEEYNDINMAIAREKQLKNWHREWKLNLIRKINPKFVDLSIIA
ncbi:MAG: GIY-YIG nuclease family protein [Candidatus Levybacteria bacterium]|nr:GIY-YIG nuclease family protein [Candidatus Levybacteria bacterium]